MPSWPLWLLVSKIHVIAPSACIAHAALSPPSSALILAGAEGPEQGWSLPPRERLARDGRTGKGQACLTLNLLLPPAPMARLSSQPLLGGAEARLVLPTGSGGEGSACPGKQTERPPGGSLSSHPEASQRFPQRSLPPLPSPSHTPPPPFPVHRESLVLELRGSLMTQLSLGLGESSVPVYMRACMRAVCVCVCVEGKEKNHY